MDIFVEMLTLMTAGYKEGIQRKPQRWCYTICRRRRRRSDTDTSDSDHPCTPEELQRSERRSPTGHERSSTRTRHEHRRALATRSFTEWWVRSERLCCKFYEVYINRGLLTFVVRFPREYGLRSQQWQHGCAPRLRLRLFLTPRRRCGRQLQL